MQVKTLEIRNFRGIRSLKIDFHEIMNVFIGENGCGKSAVLDLLAIMLSWLTARIRHEKANGKSYSELDITNDEAFTNNIIGIVLDGRETSWRYGKARAGRMSVAASDFGQIKSVVRRFQNGFENNENQSLPLIAHYPVGRAVFEVPLRIRGEHLFDQFSAYESPLTARNRYFRTFFEWFRNRDDIENEAFRKQGEFRFSDKSESTPSEFPDAQLHAVKTAIGEFLPGFSELTVQRKPRLQMTIRKGNEKLVIDQLSDGEKCALAMIGDLARRLAIANPSLEDPLQGYGVVMIDEIDLHLHPAWQRMIIPGLLRTFPNCQFILTTHSPLVLSHVRADSVFILKKEGRETKRSHPEGSYGLDSNYILEVFMSVPSRNENVKKQLGKLFDTIDRGDLELAKEIAERIRKEVGDIPELGKADVLIRRKKVLGK